MPRPLRPLVLLLLPALLAGCAGSGGGGGSTVSGDVLRIYSSQPLKGRLGDQALAIVRGERLALADAGGRVGKRRVELLAFDDADPETGTWDPGLVSANARKAAQDDKTIAYLGEMDTGASAVSIPILNETDILEVSPTDTVAGFTREKGANPGEPDKYYPTRDRNFARLVPPDDVQAAALLTLMQDERATRAFVVSDGKLYGQELGRQVTRGARAKGVDVVKAQTVDLEDADLGKLASEIAASGADAFVYTGDLQANTPALFRAVAAAAPKIKLFGPGAVADDVFAAQLGPAAGPRTFITAPWLALKDYPPEARKVARRYEERYRTPMPAQGLYGYEAMSAVLAAIERAGKDGNDRGEVIDEMLKTRGRSSVLGTYSIDENGDTSIKRYGSYRVRDGSLVFVRVLDPLGA
jgi:branched-chain amino acid transport system substrate-binding protein